MDCVVIHQEFGVAQCKGVVVDVELLATLESDGDGFVLIIGLSMDKCKEPCCQHRQRNYIQRQW